jgi:hypothetical protein
MLNPASLKNESKNDSLWPGGAIKSAKSRFQDRLCRGLKAIVKTWGVKVSEEGTESYTGLSEGDDSEARLGSEQEADRKARDAQEVKIVSASSSMNSSYDHLRQCGPRVKNSR